MKIVIVMMLEDVYAERFVNDVGKKFYVRY